MSSRNKGGGKNFSAAAAGGDIMPAKEKGFDGSSSGKKNPNLEQLSRDLVDVSIDPSQAGEWEVIGKKSKNRAGTATGRTRGSQAPTSKAWGQSEVLPRQSWGASGGAGRIPGNNWAQAGDSRKAVGRGNSRTNAAPRSWESAYMAPPPPPNSVPPPLQHGWQWGARGGSSGSQPKAEVSVLPQGKSTGGCDSDSDLVHKQQDDASDDDDDDIIEDTDDDLSDYDSDASQRSHETRKKNKWFKPFFDELDKLTVDQISEPTRQWHCPACHDGPGAIDWYNGLQPLMTHAKTKGSTRVKLHRELCQLLDEELSRRGTGVIPAGEAFGKWKGLRESTTDHDIVWPPMVVVMNTLLELDENEKWIGMGNQELLDYFNTYEAVKARHAYGPHGHRGMSLLIFEANAMGYLAAERLHKHFAEQGTDRDAWERRRVLFYPGGKRQLYGYLAKKEDMDVFNQHCQGKSRLKFEMRSYQEMVVTPMKQMSEDNQQLVWLKNRFVKQERRSKALEETFGVVSQKLRETMEENRIVRLRTKIQHEEDTEQMNYQEEFFKDQMAKVQKDIEEKEKHYECLLQEERNKAKQSDLTSGSNEARQVREEEIARFIDGQMKGVEEFESEREKLMRAHAEKKVDLKRRYLEEEVELEKDFEKALTQLMDKYAPSTFQASASA